MRKRILVAVMAVMGLTNLATAQDAPADNDGKWQFRLRGIVISPDESADIEAIGGDVDISNAVVPEFDITYFFNDNWSLELILGTAKHDVEAVGTDVGDIDLGSVWLLPPTLTAQYHFTGGDLVP